MNSDDTGDEPLTRTSRRRLLATTGALGAGLFAGCLGDGSGPGDGGDSNGSGGSGDSMADGTTTETEESMADGTSTETEDSMADGTSTETGDSMDGTTTSGGERMGESWRSIELTTVRGEETFTIDELDGPVVVQSFAVWCPNCERQSGHLKTLDDSLTVVGLNTDPNEDAAKVRRHADENGFDWRFAVAPTEMTKSLVEEFGPTVTNAPSTPIIVACEDGSAEFMAGNVAPAGEIEAAAEGC